MNANAMPGSVVRIINRVLHVPAVQPALQIIIPAPRAHLDISALQIIMGQTFARHMEH